MSNHTHNRRWTAAALCLLGYLTANAYDFMEDGLAYNKLDDQTVELTSTVAIGLGLYQEPDDDEHFGFYTGMWVVDGENYLGTVPTGINYPDLGSTLVIPSCVNHQGTQYKVTGIGDLAFAFTNITSVEIPPSITCIGCSAFQDCNDLTAVHISDVDAWCRIDFKGYFMIGSGNWFWEDETPSSTGNPTEYAHHLYVNNQELTSVVIPDDVTRLNCTFHNCTNLTQVVMPESVTNLGTFTFAGTGISSLPINEVMTEIPRWAFSHCEHLSDTVYIPANIITITESAFAYSPIGCLFLPATIQETKEKSFEATGLRHIYSPANHAPCTINTLGDHGRGWSAFDEETYSDAVLHIPFGADYSDRYDDQSLYEWVSGWTLFQHIEKYGGAIQAITLNQASLTLDIASTSELTAVFTPSESVVNRTIWTSSNPAVATIESIGSDKGRVHALTPGSAIITATTTDGSNLSASCLVTVTNVPLGDVNGDGCTDVEDLNILINVVLDLIHEPGTVTRCDLNGSGNVDVEDLNQLVNAILFGDDTPPAPTSITTYTVNGATFRMIHVDGGTFSMGATAEQGDTDPWPDELPAHEVTLSGFAIGQTEVTQALWQAVMGSNPSTHVGADKPVENVSWNNCQEFLARLSVLTGHQFRLLTEAEWEYAARGGNKSQGRKYAGSDNICEVAWYVGNSGDAPRPVSTKVANELGLFDMSGNVSEWCSDYANSYTSAPQTNPTGPESGTNRQWRGGNWRTTARYCRVSNRNGSQPATTADYIGLRLALSVGK
ncbi:MAG: SUMF1/EgtB/PvdO family nonheme iron enzyme [Muribaculaceae bacterium]|nr:SUMF1/EgtB/PvdO family nonheme iron enzyme [Muribaculaceae bacterium]